jgi:hypothetical protein
MEPKVALPHTGSVDLAQLVEVIRESQITLGLTNDGVEFRSILLREFGNKGWTHAATLARVGQSVGSPQDFLWGRARCVSHSVSLRECADIEALVDNLTSWRRFTASDAPRIGSVNSTRRNSRSDVSSDPSWACSLYMGGSVAPYDTGGLFAPQHCATRRVVADDINQVARQWLELNWELSSGNVGNEIRVIIPDRRGVLAGVSLKESALMVETTGALADMELSVSTRDAHGTIWQTLIPAERRGQVSLPTPPVELRVRLWTPQGELLDEYVERGLNSSWGKPLLTDTGEKSGLLLQTTLSEGEGDEVEFKAWVPPNRQDGKLMEFLETVVAFSNTKGGDVFIGVNDYGEPDDPTRHLMRTFKDSPQPGLSEAQQRYVGTLRRLVAAAISPSPFVTFSWEELAGHGVLRVHVEKGIDPPFEISEGHHFLVRKGATNRRMSRAELALILGR